MGTPEPTPPGTPLPEEMLNYNIDEINAELEKVTNEISAFENQIKNIDNNVTKRILNNMLKKRYDKQANLLYIKSKLSGDGERQKKFVNDLNSKLEILKKDQDNKPDLDEQDRFLAEQEAERFTRGGKRSKKRRTNKRRRNSRTRRNSRRRPRK
jgi:hypothetical protein